jgi:pyruvate dehydrogenase E1 component alpha subunit
VLEARTYRHFGHSRTDPGKYRPEAEVREWMARDPLTVSRARLAALGVPDAAIDDVVAQAQKVVTEAVAAAKAARDADVAEALTDVWADGGAAWRN